MKCPICGRAELVRTTCEEIYTYKGQCLVIPSVTGDHCAVCDELILDGEDTERVMNLLLAFNKKVNASDGTPDLTRTSTPDKSPAAMPVHNSLMAGLSSVILAYNFWRCMMYVTNLRKVGGSVMLAVPPALLDLLQIGAGSQVGLAVDNGRLVVAPHVRPRYTMAELLAASSYSEVQPAEDREWVDAPAVGGEL